MMTLDEAVATFKRELPNWWWSVTECWVSIHGYCAPDWTPGYQDHPDYGLNEVELEVDKPSGPRGGTGDDPTPAQFLMLLMEKAKDAREVHRRQRKEEAVYHIRYAGIDIGRIEQIKGSADVAAKLWDKRTLTNEEIGVFASHKEAEKAIVKEWQSRHAG